MARKQTQLTLLAFDQATATTGYSVFKGTKYKTHGKIQIKEKETQKRTKDMFLEIAKVIDKIKPDVVYVEGVAMQSNASTFSLLSRLQGMIIGYCYAHNIRPEVIVPTEWRHTLGFKQGATKRQDLKKQAKEYVKRTYDIETSEDECESICIGHVATIIEGDRNEIQI